MLLRALETGEIVPLGGEQRDRVDVRIVAATDRDLGELVKAGAFREPLWHRLAGYVIRLPALRVRRDDIARLFLAFLEEELTTTGEPERLTAIGDESWLPAHVIGALCRAEWPGNVRELRNVARRIAVASRGADGLVVDDEVAVLVETIVAEELPADVSLPDVLERHGWHIADTAKALGVSRTTLYARMEACPDIRKARDLSSAELSQSMAELGGDLDTLAKHFRVSRRGLQLRLRELGL
jgi:two-component system nitrogen regulation response regulator GlnG